MTSSNIRSSVQVLTAVRFGASRYPATLPGRRAVWPYQSALASVSVCLSICLSVCLFLFFLSFSFHPFSLLPSPFTLPVTLPSCRPASQPASPLVLPRRSQPFLFHLPLPLPLPLPPSSFLLPPSSFLLFLFLPHVDLSVNRDAGGYSCCVVVILKCSFSWSANLSATHCSCPSLVGSVATFHLHGCRCVSSCLVLLVSRSVSHLALRNTWSAMDNIEHSTSRSNPHPHLNPFPLPFM